MRPMHRLEDALPFLVRDWYSTQSLDSLRFRNDIAALEKRGRRPDVMARDPQTNGLETWLPN